METIAANAMIHDWMGNKRMKPPFAHQWIGQQRAKDLKYHTSWDWLMPVVQKIYGLPRNYQRSTIEFSFYQDGFTIKTIWFEVVRYIEVLNSDKNDAVSDTSKADSNSTDGNQTH